MFQNLLNAINELLENKELRLKLGIEGRRLIEEQYSWEVIVKGLIEVYKDSIS